MVTVTISDDDRDGELVCCMVRCMMYIYICIYDGDGEVKFDGGDDC